MKHIIYKITACLIFLTGSQLLKAQKDKNAPITVEGKKIEEDEKVTSKEVSMETPCAANATVFVENIYRKIIIKASNDNKVKIVTNVSYRGDDPKFSDGEWFSKLNVELKGNANNVVITSGTLVNGVSTIRTTKGTGLTTTSSGQSYTTVSGYTPYDFDYAASNKLGSKATGIAVFDGDGNWVNKKSNIKRDAVIYMPAGASLDVESKYADVEITTNIKDLKIKINNANLVMNDAEKAILITSYCNINAGSIRDAEIELTNGRLAAKDFVKLNIDSKNSSIDINTVTDLSIRSLNDQFEIDEVTDLHGRKDYGNLRITSVKKSFDLTGSNADIKIRDIDASVELIKIDDKYADIRLPVRGLKNYSVDFDGEFSSVYAPFEKQVIEKPAKDVAKETEKPDPPRKANLFLSNKKPQPTATTIYYGSGGNWGEGQDARFTASVGDIKGKHTQIQLKCINCTVDFK
ncbi:MAG: hypothetical protein V4722_04595 [Bacteroidota bacterium]